MRKAGRHLIIFAFLLAALALSLSSAMAQEPALPPTQLAQIQTQITALDGRLNTLLNSIADWKVQAHDDANQFVTKEEFNNAIDSLQNKQSTMPDAATIYVAIFLVNALFFLAQLVLRGQGKMGK